MAEDPSSFQYSSARLSEPEPGSEWEPDSSDMLQSVKQSPLQPLKAIVLSLDWEISDDTISSFIAEIQRLNTVMQGDAVVQKFLQLLDSLGKYVFKRKNTIHPDSIRLLHSAYKGLEEVLLNADMDEFSRRSLLFDQLTEYRKLKEKVSARPQEHDSKPVTKPFVTEGISESDSKAAIPVSMTDTFGRKSDPPVSETATSATMTHLEPHEAFSLAIDEIKHMIQAEFRALRAEIHLWRMEK
jgi:hypothetical protein